MNCRTCRATIFLAISLVCAQPVVAGPLHDAAKNGDLAAAKELIAQGAPVNEKDHGGDTPLYWAVRKDHLAVVKLLVANGANVNERDQSAARVAAHYYKKRGTKINESEIIGPTLLHMAVNRNEVQVAAFLIEHGADMNARAMGGFSIGLDIYVYKNLTPLELAQYWEDVQPGKRKAIINLLRSKTKGQSANESHSPTSRGKDAEKRYELHGFSIAPPTGKHWQVRRATHQNVLFARSTGRGRNHTVVAWALIVKGTHAGTNPKEFLRQTMKRQLKEFEVLTRYSHLHSEVRDTRKHGLSCRESSFTVDDRGVAYAPGKTYILQGWIQDCLHPKSTVPLILMLSASQRYLQGLKPLRLDTELKRFRDEAVVMPLPK